MKKNLFLVIGILYFFVLQFLVVGYLRNESNFFVLALVNAVIFVISLSGFLASKESKSELGRKGILKKIYNGFLKFVQHYAFVLSLFVLFLAVVDKVFFGFIALNLWYFVGIFLFFAIFSIKKLFQRKVYLGKKLFLPKDALFFVSVIVALLVFWLLDLEIVLISVQIFLSAVIGFLVFVLGIWVVKAIGPYSVWKLITTRLYVVLMIGSVLFVVPQWYFNMQKTQIVQGGDQFLQFTWDSIVEQFDAIKNKLSGNEEEIVDPNLHEGTGEVLSSGFGFGEVLDSSFGVENGSGEIIVETGNVLSGEVATGVEELGWILTGIVEEKNEDDSDYFSDISDDQILNYGQVLKYLMDVNDISLSSSTNVSFTNISSSNELYPYAVTAYNSSLIGKTINPLNQVKCDNYLVMKGILLDWSVDATAGDIFAQYYQAAKNLRQLNGCELGSFLKKENL